MMLALDLIVKHVFVSYTSFPIVVQWQIDVTRAKSESNTLSMFKSAFGDFYTLVLG